MRALFQINFFLILLLSCLQANAQYYKTLPEGVRLLNTRYIKSNISSSFNRSKSESPYQYEIQADTQQLESINNQTLNDALEVLQEYPEAYDKFTLGTHKLDAKADVNVEVLGFAYGISNQVTAYVGIPIYQANVKLNYSRPQDSTQQEVAQILQSEYGDNWAQTVGNILEKIYQIDQAAIQSTLVNHYGYQELGDWNGTGLGDIELGFMYNFKETKTYGLKSTIGFIAPTGYTDDPDLIQDIGFGDGQWDIFFEFGSGIRVADNTYFNIWSRYTYQMETTKKLRVPYDEDIFISSEKGSFREKLGNQIELNLNLGHTFNDWFTLTPEFNFNFTEAATYSSDHHEANDILAMNTESYSQNFKIAANFSSIELFQKNSFLLPAQLNLSYQTMLTGKNTPKVDLLEIDFRLFF